MIATPVISYVIWYWCDAAKWLYREYHYQSIMVSYNNAEIWQWFTTWIYDISAHKSYDELYLGFLAPIDILCDYT